MVKKEITPLLAATLKALVYADLFDYPLKKDELWKRLISPKKVSRRTFWRLLPGWQKEGMISEKNSYYLLPKQEKNILIRESGERRWPPKYERAKKAAEILAGFRSVWMVGLTGGVATGAAKVSDDIDLMVITAPGKLWLTRILCWLSLKTVGRLKGLRVRRPNDQAPKDKICLNLFLDAADLKIDTSSRNLFSSYELILVRPLVNKHHVHSRFLYENRWAKRYLANSFPVLRTKWRRLRTNPADKFLNYLAFLAEGFYMRGKPGAKKITPTQAFFHPRDLSKRVLANFSKKCLSLGIPLDKNALTQ